MKRIFVFLLALTFMFVPIFQQSLSIFLTPDEWQSFIEYDDWAGLFDEYIFPELFSDDQALVLFSAELNISNGEREKWGERYMFGKLESQESVRDRWQEYSDYELDAMALEVHRLLLGPWIGPGSTEFARATLKFSPYRALISDGRWQKITPTENSALIKIIHKTDRYGSTRNAWLLIVETGEMGQVLPDLMRYDIYLVKPNT